MKKYGFIVLAFMFVVSVAQAGWFDFDKKEDKKKPAAPAMQQNSAIKRYHLTVPDKKTERELMGLIQGRRVLTEDIRVLRRMVQDRKARFAALQKQLKDKYGILPEERYEYDPDNKALLKIIVPKADKKPADPAKADKAELKEVDVDNAVEPKEAKQAELKKEPFRKFTEEEAKNFIEIQTAKSRRGQEIMVFQRTMMEEEVQLKKTSELMSKRFAMKEGKYYDYDAKEMKLYELTPQRRAAQPQK